MEEKMKKVCLPFIETYKKKSRSQHYYIVMSLVLAGSTFISSFCFATTNHEVRCPSADAYNFSEANSSIPSKKFIEVPTKWEAPTLTLEESEGKTRILCSYPGQYPFVTALALDTAHYHCEQGNNPDSVNCMTK
jgi:hypothetical protein